MQGEEIFLGFYGSSQLKYLVHVWIRVGFEAEYFGCKEILLGG